MTPPLQVIDLGHQPYAATLELQRDLCRRRVAGEFDDDLLLLVEHEPVITLGRGTRATSLPISPDALAAHDVGVFEVERGGDVTYHGPGQLVGYPIINLSRHREDLHWYLRQLEGALIDALATLDVPADRQAGLTGVWTRGRKIASIGVHVKRWVTLHGFALNVTTDLSRFDLIVPCGIQGVVMTSVAAESPRTPPHTDLWTATRDAVVTSLGAAFSLRPVAGTLPPPVEHLVEGA